jgi:hypothetical protein
MAEQLRRERLRREMIDEIIATARAHRAPGGRECSRDLPVFPEPGRANARIE